MGILDGFLGGVVGAEVTNLVNGVIEKHGGVGGMLAELKSQGLGNAVQSWVGLGPNQSISGDQITAALGSDTVRQLAAKFGMSPDLVASKLSEVLPGAIDKLTPHGVLPKDA
jgi:uncharacterized protein YidB (DUF937 family)